MKKYSIIFCVMVQSIMMVAMDNAPLNKAQVKKMEIVRRIFRQQRNTVDMSLESNSQTEDEMSYSGSLSSSQSSSGSFPIVIVKKAEQQTCNNSMKSSQSRTPRQRESSKILLYDLGEYHAFLTFELHAMHFE
jgi:hypothetical protein